MVVPASVLGKGGAKAPNERVQMACIGVGGMGSGNLRSLVQDQRVEMLAVCDVDANHRKAAMPMASNKGYADFREVIARKDIDAVMIATPDHWHAIITGAAIKAGKDVYCEKPLAASIAEGRYVSDLVRKHKTVLQCGTWRRSGVYTRMACEWVRNGYIGKLKHIEVGVPARFAVRGGYSGMEPPQAIPETLNYDMWLGPCPEAEYTESRVHFNFRWLNAYAPGYITDWGAHFLDVAQWGNDSDNTTPVSVKASKVAYRGVGLYDAPEDFQIDYRYANGVTMSMVATADESQWGTKFVGEEGWVFTENSKLETQPAELRQVRLKKTDTKLYESKNHHRNFIDCVYSRKRTAAPAEAAHRAATCCHLGGIAAELGDEELQFDPKRERFINSDEANKHLTRSMRGSWRLA